MFSFIIAFIYIGLISTQIFHISHGNYLYAFLSSLGIGTCWILNVKIAIGDSWIKKFLYILGGACGTIVSMYFNLKMGV